MTQLMLTDSDIGKKVYEFEQEVTLVIKTQVIGKNQDDAFNKWLNETSTHTNHANQTLFFFSLNTQNTLRH